VDTLLCGGPGLAIARARAVGDRGRFLLQRAPCCVSLPTVPGAEYLGSKECEQCHEKIYRDFIARRIMRA
jgi:hypothetical protein